MSTMNQIKINVNQFSGPTDFSFHNDNRSGFQREFVEKLLSEPGLNGEVLDIGCGPDLPTALNPLRSRLLRLDGLDPNREEVEVHPLLRQRWVATLEEAPLPENHYDLAYSYNVADPAQFFARIVKILKPGGVYWSLSNHSLHPFARIVRIIEGAKLKKAYSNSSEVKVNDYPAHYRMNSVAQYRQHCPLEQFEQADFYLYPCAQWDQYFPRAIRFAPHLYDRLLGTRYRSCMMIFMARLQKRR